MTVISKKLYNVLKAKTTLSEEEISFLTESTGWGIIYSQLKNTPKAESKMAVCFTGFNDVEKKELINIAKTNNMHHAHGVTQNLMFLCCGSNPGALKLKAANEAGITIITKEEFLFMIETGTIKDSVNLK